MSENPEKQYALRLPVGLYHELEGWAREELRSVNAQIVAVLRDAVAQRKRKKPPGDTPESTDAD